MLCRQGLHALGRTALLNPGMQPPRVPFYNSHPLWDPRLWGPDRVKTGLLAWHPLPSPDLEGDCQARKLGLTLGAEWLKPLGTSCSSKVTSTWEENQKASVLFCFQACNFPISFMLLPPPPPLPQLLQNQSLIHIKENTKCGGKIKYQKTHLQLMEP